VTLQVHAPILVGVHGTLNLYPWTAAARDDGVLVDAFSLLAMRSSLLGMASFGSDDASTTPQWGHADAGDAWEQDGPPRDLRWYHVVVPPTNDVAPLRLPLQSLLEVVDSSLRQLGAADVHAVRAFLPLQLARGSWRELISGFGWLQLAAPQPDPITIDVSIEAGERARITDRIEEAVDVLTQTVDDSFHVEMRPGVTMPPRFSTWETLPTYRRRDAVGLRCNVPGWSAPAAAWLIEAITNACLDAGVRDPLLIDAERVA
jgi:hypothetical protein